MKTIQISRHVSSKGEPSPLRGIKIVEMCQTKWFGLSRTFFVSRKALGMSNSLFFQHARVDTWFFVVHQ